MALTESDKRVAEIIQRGRERVAANPSLASKPEKVPQSVIAQNKAREKEIIKIYGSLSNYAAHYRDVNDRH